MSRSKHGLDGPAHSSAWPDGLLVRLTWLFLFALAIRWMYVLTIYSMLGESGLLAGDSRGYLHDAHAMAELLRSGALRGWQLLGEDLSTMPVFTWLLTAHVLACSEHGSLTYVLFQGALDSATCLVVFGMAAAIRERLAMTAGIIAAINPTQIILAGLVYTDTPFVLLVSIALFGSLRWLRYPTLSSAVLIGVGLGGAMLTRVLIAPFIPVLILFLIATAVLRGTLDKRRFGHALLAAAIPALCIAPILLRNVIEHRTFALTPQGGLHLAYWVVPLVKEAKDGTPWERTAEAMSKRVKERAPNLETRPFEEARIATAVGREALAELGPLATAKAWLVGAAINLAAPAIIISPPIARLPRTGFYATEGASVGEKVFNFIFRSESRSHGWALLLGILGVIIMRVLQLSGFVSILRSAPFSTAALFALWIAFILAANGPVGSPKYRLPLEPVFNVLAAAGFFAFRDWRRRRQAA